MTVLDSYAVLAYLKGEAAATDVGPLIARSNCSLTALSVAEVLDHLVRLVGEDEEDAALDLAELGLLDGTAVDGTLGVAAGRLRARHYHRSRCAVSLADCVAAEVARSQSRPLATADPNLLDVCHAGGVELLVLPASDGSRWSPPRP